MTNKADIDALQKAIELANKLMYKLDLCGLYDAAWQAHDGYVRMFDYNKEQLEVTDDEQ